MPFWTSVRSRGASESNSYVISYVSARRTIQKCWTDSEYGAVDVVLEDRHKESFRLPKLEVVDEGIAVEPFTERT